jgi:hypothetical protein
MGCTRSRHGIYTTPNFSSPANFTAVAADVVNPFDLLWSHDLQNDTGLLVYGDDASKKAVWANSVTGASPIVWVGRSGGICDRAGGGAGVVDRGSVVGRLFSTCAHGTQRSPAQLRGQ